MANENEKKNPKSKFMGFTASFDLSEWLERQAESQHRSVSGQINLILEKARAEDKKCQENAK